MGFLYLDEILYGDRLLLFLSWLERGSLSQEAIGGSRRIQAWETGVWLCDSDDYFAQFLSVIKYTVCFRLLTVQALNILPNPCNKILPEPCPRRGLDC